MQFWLKFGVVLIAALGMVTAAVPAIFWSTRMLNIFM
jgi:hypothetical protein